MKLRTLVILAVVASATFRYTYSALTNRTFATGCQKLCGCGTPAKRTSTRSCGMGATCYVSECQFNITGCGWPYETYNDICLSDVPGWASFCPSCMPLDLGNQEDCETYGFNWNSTTSG